ncbi:hypothetical protein AB4298_13365 [Shewanella sp. 10N.261.52.F9]|uniref:Uncharacterized protein n=1 Tax=Shewanella sairae TaxID=190310 RepID=A0ABQ4P192_9GAMM|nr:MULTISPECIES: hypothetical protein [Shewanella]MCL1128698.1 hypothetical protein [Shewanella sairae]MCL1148218.1 hypothetical protein [Shewanella marinintestina]GIU41282.1 hypothetical protein TUM4438_04960 [Shewanella sairae]
MFNSTVSKTIKASLLTAVILGVSATAQADNSLISDVASNIEQNISSQMQEMMSKAQTELSLSIQSQMSEMMFDMDSEQELANKQGAATLNEQPLVTTAVSKD